METPLQLISFDCNKISFHVTILVLVETLLQCSYPEIRVKQKLRHNPCFSGNSFAIVIGIVIKKLLNVTILVLVETPLQ